MTRGAATRAGRPAEKFTFRVKGLAYGPLDAMLTFQIRRAQIAIHEDFLRTLAGLPITPPLFTALVLVRENPGISQVVLSRAMGIARSGVLVLIDRLEGRGLVERQVDPSSRRVKQLFLTPAGRKETARLIALVRKHDERMSQQLSAQEKALLRDLLARIDPPRTASG